MNNIIIVKLDSTYTAVYSGIWQWNYGQILRIQGGSLPKVVEVHFSLQDKGGDSITRIGTTVDGATDVPIPDSFLENGGRAQDYKIYAFIYLEDGTAGNTEYKIEMSVKSRPKPEVPGTPEEPELFRETVKAVNDAADRAYLAEQNAKASATETSKYTAGASESAVAAEKTKEDALKEVGEKKQEAIEAIQEQEETSVGKIINHTDDEIKRILNQTAGSKRELEQTITHADASKKELDESIQTAGDTKTALDKSTELAGTAKTELDTSTQKAGEAKMALDGSAKTAGEMQETLSATVKQAGALDTSLSEKIETGIQLKTDLVASGEKAVQDIQAAGSEQLDKMKAVAEEFTADREQITTNKEDIGSIKEDTDKYIIKKIKGSVTTSKAPDIVLRYNCQINKGDKVSVKSEYDGNNIQTYDIRFYDASGNIHVIVQSVPIREEYVFMAEESYSEISLYAHSDNIVEGMRFTTIVNVDGVVLNDIHDLRVKQDVQSTELTDAKDSISNKYDKESVNILDVTKAIANKFINADTGAAVDNSTDYWLASDFIKLNANTRYYCNGIYLNGIFGFYTSKDANTFVKSPAGVEVHGLSDLNYKKGYIETGSSEIYFRGSIASEMKDSAYISEWVDEYVLHQALPLKDFVHIAAEGSKLKGKKILVIGDSISTDYYGSYPKWVTALIKAHYLPLDAVNNSIHATGFVADAGTAGNDFLSRLKAVENKSSFDLVIVFGGINDYSLYKQEDNISATFTDAVDSFFEYLINNYVNARFGVIKPMLCNRPGRADDADKIRLYADYIANTAKKYAIPTLNFTDESGFNPFITQIYERWSLLPSGQDLHDGIHPNEEFERKFMAPQIKHFIDGLI